MPKLCCFLCPKSDYADRSLDDTCPDCGYKYGFPLVTPPTTILDYEITEPVSRGFYAATFVAKRPGMLARPVLLKVVSKRVYDFFQKDFARECRDHVQIAEGSDHVVTIEDARENVDVDFGSLRLTCHVAILQYIKGVSLDTLMKEKARLTARTVAQIGIDLFRMLDEFRGKVSFHNDLHGNNIMIERVTGRADALDPTVRAVAIDLGSASDASKSDTDGKRLGDIHWIASHLLRMVDNLLRDCDGTSDLDYRLASTLEEIAHRLSPSSAMSRTPEVLDLIDEIKTACHHVSSPWREPLRLQKYNASYNAQTLAPWYVPLLLVDPKEQWLGRMSTPGPQIITGMRGCGKTLFLRALQFHARAAERDGEASKDILARLKADRFIGLYVSTNRLLDRPGMLPENLHEPYARLYVAYGLEAICAVQHLQAISAPAVRSDYVTVLAQAIGDFLSGDNRDIRGSSSAHELQHALIRALVSLSRGESRYSLTGNPAVAFPHMAEAIQRCSPLWETSQVLYLLDDVSTRYLREPRIAELLSVLLFQSTSCAFKITSEAQTLELALRSPGQIELARAGRDYDVFDLGAEVYSRITTRKRGGEEESYYGKYFVQQILQRRAKYYFNHPQVSPTALLGDATLESIAEAIAASSRTSRKKKEVYHGITALARVCVGDIGDVISLYELILQKAEGRSWPVPKATQSESYQEFCSRRLYDLNRRENKLKDVALSFAEASHNLLVKSYREKPEGPIARDRLRQYMTIYVRITTGDVQWQYDRLRDLIDSGLFVFAGGSDTPRTKTKDSNPTQQFKLTYRKIYGLSNFIGLAESDRFELSGEQLEEWLKKPSKDVLIRNLGGTGNIEEVETADDGANDTGEPKQEATQTPELGQGTLFHGTGVVGPLFSSDEDVLDAATVEWLGQYIPSVQSVPLRQLAKVPFATIMLGLGFEDRTLASAERLCRGTKAHQLVLFRYPEVGKAERIEQLARQLTSNIRVVDYGQDMSSDIFANVGETLVDVTGLAKPIIFRAIRGALKANSSVWICHTRAKSYYPQERDLAKVVAAETTRNHYALLESLRNVMTGERGPYHIYSLHSSEVDQSRRRVLFAFASAKHERLLALLEERDYDHVELIVPQGETARSRVARIAAEVAVKSHGRGMVNVVDTNDLTGVLAMLAKKYQHWYVNRGFNVDLALTGSKIQGVASAVLSSFVKVSEAIYVSPEAFDPRRFTKGVGSTTVYRIALR